MKTRLPLVLLWFVFLACLTLGNSALATESQTSSFLIFVNDPTDAGPVPWSNPANAAMSDDIYAELAFQPGQMYVSQFLKATNAGLAIPASATIIGIETKLEARATDLGATLVYVRPIKHGMLTSIPRTTYLVPGASDSIYTLGGPTDLWATPWTPGDLNSNDFGMVVAVLGSAQDTAGVDFLSVVIYYLPARAYLPFLSQH